MPVVAYNEEYLLERIATLEAERDRAREECGHEKAMRAAQRVEFEGFLRRSVLAQQALVSTGYFTKEQVDADLAPRIIELWSAFGWCFCKDVALLRGDPVLLHGVEHTREGCHYGPTEKGSQPSSGASS